MNKTKLTKQEYRIVLDAYLRDFQQRAQDMGDEEHEIYVEIRNKLVKFGEVEV